MQIYTENTKEVQGPTYCTMLTFLIFPLQYVLYSVLMFLIYLFIIQSWVKFHSRLEHLTTV